MTQKAIGIPVVVEHQAAAAGCGAAAGAARSDSGVSVPVSSVRGKNDKYRMDGNKMVWHLERVAAWQRGERIAPIHIDAGLSKGCNIKCHYCYGVTQGNFFRKGSERVFPREALIRYMREAGEVGVRSIALIGEAEPTLNPAVYEAIVAGKKAGVDMSMGTNGVLLDTGKAGQEALEHLTWIRFNISAASDYSYRRVHASKEFPTVMEKIKFCVDYKRKNNLPLTVGLQMVLTPKDVNEAVPLAKLGKELGADYLVIKHCSDTVENDLGIFEKLGEYHSFVDVLKEAESHSEGDYNVIVKWDKITNNGHRDYDQCLGAPFLLYTSGDGKVYSCGMFFEGAYEKDFFMGDLTEKGFKEILESDHYWRIIEKVKNEIDVHKQCYANCRTHSVNNFLWDLKSPPPHVNFV